MNHKLKKAWNPTYLFDYSFSILWSSENAPDVVDQNYHDTVLYQFWDDLWLLYVKFSSQYLNSTRVANNKQNYRPVPSFSSRSETYSLAQK